MVHALEDEALQPRVGFIPALNGRPDVSIRTVLTVEFPSLFCLLHHMVDGEGDS